MFIQTEDTPNPNTLKFIPGIPVLEQGTADFSDKSHAKKSHLANLIFSVEGVKKIIFINRFYINVKFDESNWNMLKPLVLTSIMDHFSSGKSVIEKDYFEEAKISHNSEKDNEIVKQIRELIDQRVRPAVAMDGGDITFVLLKNGIVTLQMKGACAGCPSSTATLKMGIENMLRHYIPEVVEVKAAEL